MLIVVVVVACVACRLVGRAQRGCSSSGSDARSSHGRRPARQDAPSVHHHHQRRARQHRLAESLVAGRRGQLVAPPLEPAERVAARHLLHRGEQDERARPRRSAVVDTTSRPVLSTRPLLAHQERHHHQHQHTTTSMLVRRHAARLLVKQQQQQQQHRNRIASSPHCERGATDQAESDRERPHHRLLALRAPHLRVRRRRVRGRRAARNEERRLGASAPARRRRARLARQVLRRVPRRERAAVVLAVAVGGREQRARECEAASLVGESRSSRRVLRGRVCAVRARPATSPQPHSRPAHSAPSTPTTTPTTPTLHSCPISQHFRVAIHNPHTRTHRVNVWPECRRKWKATLHHSSEQ